LPSLPDCTLAGAAPWATARLILARSALAGSLLLALAGAAGAAETPLGGGPEPGRRVSVTLDVLTYNIEGVPRRRGRARALAEIGLRLDAMRRAGEGPDVVLVQEAFSRTAVDAIAAAGYPNLVRGPSRTQRRQLPSEGGRRSNNWRKGELGLKIVGAGLIIASLHPIEAGAAEPFSRRACAGFDCLANKGVLFARLRVPGVPDPIDLFNTHMNAQTASGVSPRRHNPVHEAQVLESANFIGEQHQPGNPIILGGDFNMRGSEARFDAFRAAKPLTVVHQFCVEQPTICDVRASWDGDAPWLDTQDLQLFRSGERVSVRPVRVETLFDGDPDSPKLSDHDAFRVVYALSWISP